MLSNEFQITVDGCDYQVRHYTSYQQSIGIKDAEGVPVAHADIDPNTESVDIVYHNGDDAPSHGSYSFHNFKDDTASLVGFCKWLVATHPING